MQRLNNILDKISNKRRELGIKGREDFANDTEWLNYKINQYNKIQGNLDIIDGYNCVDCLNRGYFYFLQGNCETIRDCHCMEVRNSIALMKKSGLENVITKYTFNKYLTENDWQKEIKNKALEYIKDDLPYWWYIGGAVGAGKTHICTAIARHFIAKGIATKYMMWKEEVKQLKSCVNDEQVYNEKISKIKDVPVLYIDDLFKPTRDRETGNMLNPTAADINIAYEIINYRYNQPKLRTIISSELTLWEIVSIDEATGSRIFEKVCGATGKPKYQINIKKDPSKNYRLRGMLND